MRADRKCRRELSGQECSAVQLSGPGQTDSACAAQSAPVRRRSPGGGDHPGSQPHEPDGHHSKVVQHCVQAHQVAVHDELGAEEKAGEEDSWRRKGGREVEA